MEIISLSKIKIDDIVARLKSGAAIVYPTETCYGLGGDATKAATVERLFTIKQRQQDKSLLLLMADQAMARAYVEWSQTLAELAQRYWPGALTIVAPLKVGVDLPRGVVGQDATIAFRVTSHPLAHVLCQGLGRPLVSTSANLAAAASPYDIATVLDYFSTARHQPDIIIDAGTLPHHPPSTIVRVVGSNIKVIRQGEVIVRLSNFL